MVTLCLPAPPQSTTTKHFLLWGLKASTTEESVFHTWRVHMTRFCIISIKPVRSPFDRRAPDRIVDFWRIKLKISRRGILGYKPVFFYVTQLFFLESIWLNILERSFQIRVCFYSLITNHLARRGLIRKNFWKWNNLMVTKKMYIFKNVALKYVDSIFF